MLFSAFKDLVLKSYPDKVPSDTLFEDAIAAFVQSELSRLGGDMTRFKTYRGSYRSLRMTVTGYTYGKDLASLKAAAYLRLRGTSDNLDRLLVEAGSKYVAYQTRAEVDRDDKLATTLGALYQAARLKAVGHTYTGTPSEFNAAVRAFLPVDNSRRNFSEPGGLLDALVETFLAEHDTLTAQVDQLILSGQEDLEQSKAWYDQKLQELLHEIHVMIPEYTPVSFKMYDFTRVQDEGEASAPTSGNAIPGPVERVRLRWSVTNSDGNIDREESGVNVLPWSHRELITRYYDTRNEEPKIAFDGDGGFVIYPKIVSGFPVWASGTEYTDGDLVEFEGTYYKAASSGTSSGPSPAQDISVLWEYIDQTRPVELWIWYRVTSIPNDAQEVKYTELLAQTIGAGIRYHSLMKVGGRDREAALALEQHRRLRRLAFVELQNRLEDGDKLDPLCGLTNKTNTIKSIPTIINSQYLLWDNQDRSWDQLQTNWA